LRLRATVGYGFGGHVQQQPQWLQPQQRVRQPQPFSHFGPHSQVVVDLQQGHGGGVGIALGLVFAIGRFLSGW
jgi:hypothetical protein